MNGSVHLARPPSPAEAGFWVPPNMRRQKSLVRRIERCCTVSLKSFPLLFVYGVTTWALYTGVRVCLVWQIGSGISSASLVLLVLFYCLLNWSYTVAVFTDPGSPINPPSASAPFSFSLRRKDSGSRGEYSYLPTIEPTEARPESPPLPAHNSNLSRSPQGRQDQASIRSLTVKSTGGLRFCKKCQTRKPDRAHHCSTCGRCVLKMDHHCPWLATCVGLKNYKPFLLFCAYVTLFCVVCFGVAASFVSDGMLSDRLQANGDWFAVNVILLAIMGAIFGLVLAAFTGWHISLALRNQTTIEALETTRYLRPIRRTMDRATAAFPARSGALGSGQEEEEGLMHQLAEMHANAVPGVTREEEGEERPSLRGPGRSLSPANDYHRRPPPSLHPHPGQPVAVPSAAHSLQTSYAQLEAQRERARYEDYLDEQETTKMPHAFDRGWKQNLRDLFGPDWRLWLVPLPSTAGDGWSWTPSERWLRAQDERQRRREERARQAAAYDDPSHSNGHANNYGHGAYANGYTDGIYDGDGVPTSIPHAYTRGSDGNDGYAAPDHDDETFRGVDAPLGGSWRGQRGRGHCRGESGSGGGGAADADTSSVDALFARDDEDEQAEEDAAKDLAGARPSLGDIDDDGETGWRW